MALKHYSTAAIPTRSFSSPTYPVACPECVRPDQVGVRELICTWEIVPVIPQYVLHAAWWMSDIL